MTWWPWRRNRDLRVAHERERMADRRLRRIEMETPHIEAAAEDLAQLSDEEFCQRLARALGRTAP